MIHAVGINMEKNNQENKKLFFGRLEGSRITKRGFWVWITIAIKAKKGKKKRQAVRVGLIIDPRCVVILKFFPKINWLVVR
jgi:hypothetical protein